ncbi:hypothetical protein WMY93_017274 [Mugilogobius chulae]|uniref:Ig-like domain-containing protein n=1 Tax=Mugilogobius chulae TaxID=88201 RepID=A0AAW0NYT4_9GOBI
MNRMRPLFEVVFVLSLVSASKAQVNRHELTDFLSATVGDDITLNCSYEDKLQLGSNTLFWYKQSLGTIPVVVSSSGQYHQGKTLHGEFKEDRRFTLESIHEKNNLNIKIKHVQMFDAAVYLCINSFMQDLKILQSVTVLVKTLNSTFAVHQSPNEDTDPGQSVILNCTVQNVRCDGPHRVHWFKQAEASAAGVLYSSGGNSNQCERKTKKSPTNSCVYNLPIDNVSSEQTGTYYCAVAACGQVLFGNGTRIDIKDGVSASVVYVLNGVSVFSTSLVIGLTILICTQNITGTCKRISTAKTKNSSKLNQYKATEEVNKSDPAQDTWSECIYFRVEQ